MSDENLLDQVNLRLRTMDSSLQVLGGKVDNLSDAVVAVARIDEKIVALLDKMEVQESHINRLYGLERVAAEKLTELETKRLGDLEKKFAAEAAATAVVRKVFWYVLGALLAGGAVGGGTALQGLLPFGGL